MTQRNALTPLFSLRRDIDRLWEDAFGSPVNGSRWMPAADIRETDKELRFDFELPGLRAEDVEITAENGVLTVRGEKQEERREGEEGGRFHLVERNYGSFTRSFQLPQGIDDDKISADFDNGVLRVRVPKSPQQQPRKIRIGSGAGSSAQRELKKGESERPVSVDRAEKTVRREPAAETRS